MTLKLSEYLKARLDLDDKDTDSAMLHFTCPTCGNVSYVHISKTRDKLPFWKWVEGDSVDNLSITPSVRSMGHIHFNIEKGQVIDHKDEAHWIT